MQLLIREDTQFNDYLLLENTIDDILCTLYMKEMKFNFVNVFPDKRCSSMYAMNRNFGIKRFIDDDEAIENSDVCIFFCKENNKNGKLLEAIHSAAMHGKLIYILDYEKGESNGKRKQSEA